jgi:hypothetical protein
MRYALLVLALCAVAWGGADDAPAELPLATQLRQLDKDYSESLQSLLAKARVRDERELIEDIQARLGVVAKYRTAAPKREVRSLLIVATLRGERAELHMSDAGIAWRDVSHPNLVDIQINDTPSEPKWDSTGHPHYISSTGNMPPAVDSVVSHQFRGQVLVSKVDRGPGKYCLRISRPSRVKADEAITFRLLIKYYPPPTAAGSRGEKEPGAKN